MKRNEVFIMATHKPYTDEYYEEIEKEHAYILQYIIYSIAESMYFSPEVRKKIIDFSISLDNIIGKEPLTIQTSYPDE